FGVYLEAKAAADAALAASGLGYTIVRPGSLTDEPATDRVAVAPELPPGQIPRADVALVLLACLTELNTIGKAFDVTSGLLPIHLALSEL
ncbi:MAG: hypothetical protein QOG59_108, partial [Solirubrobacteraceae bacterium]|nr:hypothetical protein [Solirubrobacteraceae bacterium]